MAGGAGTLEQCLARTLDPYGFSKKIENHAAAVAIWFMYYNFCRAHQTLRITPAMESGISNHAWTIEELRGLLPESASATKRIDKGLIRKALGQRAVEQ